MARKVQIEVTGPVQDPVTGEVLHQPGSRFDEGAKELDGLPSHMLRAVLTEEPDKAEKDEPKPPAPAAAARSAAQQKA